MLIPRRTLELIAAGWVTLAFRRWRRPSVRAGGTLRTAVGVLRIGAVEPVDPAAISEEEARLAGQASVAELRSALDTRTEGPVYRVELSLSGADPRDTLRTRVAEGVELTELLAALDRLDRASRHGPWTARVLREIGTRPGTRAAELAEAVGRPLRAFKADVRKLKDLGLTESLETGYRLSPRGAALLGSCRGGSAGRPGCG
ncbi:hypothetical protein [Amycolatopsis cihanbeyliensis]|uniref:ASCH domain-containing protein n=1 Tax=Amycolatopsis cihanbeyliensis TaxID=1128664 RepID=A0A542DEN5_AMYCI|nr:hypothetical protein [Amycolatopsis cihanbeyliensis]TQJ01535.1 hypothetical protein FB471_1223 [Amycolatopsis cihanbeyliensis]